MLEHLLTDRRIVRRVLRGHTDAFSVLVDRYGGMLHGFAYVHMGNASDAEDLVQETFIRLYQWLDRMTLESTVGPWLVAVARNLIADWARRNAREAAAIDQADHPGRAKQPDAATAELHGALWNELASLDPDEREVLILSYFQGRRAKDVALLLGITPEAAWKRIQRARAELGRRMLDHLGNDLAKKPGRNRRKRIMAAITVVPIPWKAGASVSLAGAMIGGATATKTVAGIAAIGILAVAGYLFVAKGGISFLHRPADITASSIFTVEDLPTETVANNAAPVTPEAEVKPAITTDKQQPEMFPEKEVSFTKVVHGIVVDAEDRPVAGATVGIDNRNEAMERRRECKKSGEAEIPIVELAMSTATDGTGSFYFKDVPCFMKKQWTRPEVVWAESNGFAAETEVELDSPEREHYVELKLLPSGALGGIVVDATGKPVDDASVRGPMVLSSPSDPMPHSGFLWTGPDGRFLFNHIPVGEHALSVVCTGFLRLTTEPLATGRTDHVIKLDSGCSISGRAIAPDGGAVDGITIMARSVEGQTSPNGYFSPKNSSSAEAGESGQFTISGLTPGDYKLMLRPDYRKSNPYFLRTPLLVTLPPGGPATGVELRLELGATISGRVTDAQTGEGIDKAGVNIQEEDFAVSTVTNADGAYLLKGVRPGATKLNAAVYDGMWIYEPKSISLPSNESGAPLTGIDFQLTHKKTVVGRVVDSAGRPVPGASVTAVFSDPAAKGKYANATRSISGASDQQGNFALRLEGEPKEVYLQAMTDGGVSHCVGPVAPYGQTHELRLMRAGRLEVTVENTAGAPIPNVTVTVAPKDPSAVVMVSRGRGYQFRDTISLNTSNYGYAELPSLIPGAYSLELRREGGPLAVAHATVPEGRTLRSRLVVDTGEFGMVEGVVTRNGSPLQGAQVLAVTGKGGGTEKFGGAAYTGADGKYILPMVTPGTVTVELTSFAYGPSSGATRTEIVQVTAGQGTTLNFAVDRQGTLVEGQVLVNGKAGINKQIQFYAVGSDAPVATLRTNQDGAFSTDQLQEGQYQAVVEVSLRESLPEYTVRQVKDVEVKMGDTTRVDFELALGGINAVVSGIKKGEQALLALFAGVSTPPVLSAEVLASLEPYTVRQEVLQQDGPLLFEDLPPGYYVVGAVVIPADAQMDESAAMSGIASGRYIASEINIDAGQVAEVQLPIP